ncbi:MAG: hypothetical protein MPJ24_09750, partial [Pirellulaceae bacterium]|nr:hypothetical protein [Pirellulaceae bacterium]
FSTGLQYNRNRYLHQQLGVWLQRDPLGYADGPNLYAYYPSVNGTDPWGLEKWEKVNKKKHIYRALEDGATLKNLSKQLIKHENDWVCIWPMRKPENKWGDYPTACKGAEADASNLFFSKGNRGKPYYAKWYALSPHKPKDAYIQGINKLFKQHSGWNAFFDSTAKWHTPQEAASIIKRWSKQGATPIGMLYFGGHGGPGLGIGPDLKNLFTPVDLFLVANSNANHSNVYNTAVKKVGPPKCWFSRGSSVVGFGCFTQNWAAVFATVMRKTANTYGTNKKIYAGLTKNKRVGGCSFTDDTDTFQASLPVGKIGADWIEYKGKDDYVTSLFLNFLT